MSRSFFSVWRSILRGSFREELAAVERETREIVAETERVHRVRFTNGSLDEEAFSVGVPYLTDTTSWSPGWSGGSENEIYLPTQPAPAENLTDTTAWSLRLQNGEFYYEAERLPDTQARVRWSAVGTPILQSREDSEVADFYQSLLDRDLGNPPTWVELRRLAEFGTHLDGVRYLMVRHGMDPTFEPTAPLRDADDTDTLGAETDAMLGMGEAEEWFREKADPNTEDFL